MKRNIWNSVYLLIFCVVLVSCSSKKKAIVVKDTSPNTEIDAKMSTNFNNIVARQTDFKTLSTRASTQLSLKGKSYDVTLNIRIKKGEGIWVSVTYFAGIEVARALITPDSIRVLDKMNEAYLKKPFDYVKRYSNEQVDYNTLEAIFIGNCIPFTINNKRELAIENQNLSIAGRREDLIYKVEFNSDLKPVETRLSSASKNQNLSVSNGDFQNFAGLLIPKLINISSTSGSQSVKLYMDYNKTILNEPVDFPFNVSKRFSLID